MSKAVRLYSWPKMNFGCRSGWCAITCSLHAYSKCLFAKGDREVSLVLAVPLPPASSVHSSYQTCNETNYRLPARHNWRGMSVLQVRSLPKLLCLNLSGWNGDFFKKDLFFFSHLRDYAKPSEITSDCRERSLIWFNNFIFYWCCGWLKSQLFIS